MRQSGCSWVNRHYQGILGFLRQIQGHKIRCRIEIVFCGFVDYAQVAFLGSISINNNLVHFSFFQIITIPILDAKGKIGRVFFGFHSESIQKSLDFHLSLTDTMRFIPMYFCSTDAAILKYHDSDTFELSPSAAAVLLA